MSDDFDDRRVHGSRSRGGKPAVAIRLLAGVLGLIGLVLAVGGVVLLTAGGSAYYLLAGLGLLLSAWLIWRGRVSGAWTYLAVVAATLLWALWESGFNGWALVPRLVGPVLLAVAVLIALPWLRRGSWRQAGIGGALLAVGVVVVVAGVAATDRDPLIAAVPVPGSGALSDPALSATGATTGADWPAYGGTQSAERFSSLAEITPANVGRLERAWVFHTGDVPEKKYGAETTPIKVGNSVYLCSGRNEMFALDAHTGRRRWAFDPGVQDKWIPYTAACRGVTYYRAPQLAEGAECAARIIEGTLDGRLIAVDAATGVPCRGFGTNGQADIKIGMGRVIPGMVAITSPPVVVRGTIITGQEVHDGQYLNAPSGVIQGFDAVTGAFKWAWDMDRPGQTGRPGAGETFTRGTPNMWTMATGDETLGLVYLPMGNHAVDYWSHPRSPAANHFATSLVALDATTGQPRWRFQTVHKDVWDYDLGSQATLFDLPGGVPALLLPSKQGDLYVLDRRTGQPLTPVGERDASTGGVEPAERSPTQPFSRFHTLARPPLRETDMWGLSPVDQMICRIQYRRASYDGMYTPPLAARRSIEYPGYNGGSDWGSVAVDPGRGVIVANYNDVPNYNRLIPRNVATRHDWFPVGMKPDAGKPEGIGFIPQPGDRGAQWGTPFGISVNAGWLMPFTKVSCKQPPLGGIRAIDLKTGRTLWDRPLGTARRNGPFGLPSHLPFNIGTPNNGGPLVTAGGLVFVAAATDNLIRAIDLSTGRTVWQDVLPAGGQATPMTYQANGRQYVVIMAGGHHFMRTPSGDSLVAYALPQGKRMAGARR